MNRQPCPEIRIRPEEACEGFKNDLFPHDLVLKTEKPFEVPRKGKRYGVTEVKLHDQISCHRWRGNGIVATASVRIEDFNVGRTVDVKTTCQGCPYVDRKRNWKVLLEATLEGQDHGLPIQGKLF